MGFFAGFQIAIFAFVGIELVGTTAAETQDPEKTLPKAINSIPIRIIFFYVFALMAIMAVTPWSTVSPDKSPFVGMFTMIGAAGGGGCGEFCGVDVGSFVGQWRGVFDFAYAVQPVDMGCGSQAVFAPVETCRTCGGADVFGDLPFVRCGADFRDAECDYGVYGGDDGVGNALHVCVGGDSDGVSGLSQKKA